MGDKVDLPRKKINKFGLYHKATEPFVINFGIMPLVNILYDYADK